ncbi:glycosyltransferase family 2 protein [Clostridiaceae bacterium 35-E11]
MDLSIIIVNYNTKELTKQTLNSIFTKTHNFLYEVFVVDNASTDDSIEMIQEEFPQVKLIQNAQNLGFSKANNIAIRQSKGRYILLLNSDTVVIDDCLEKCIQHMDKHVNIGALGCKVILPDGNLDLACKRSFPTPEVSMYRILGLSKLFPKSKKFGQYNLTYVDENEIHEIDCLVGAFMMIRREVIEAVGLLDEDFFMYGEDVDWCYRMKEAGWKIVYYPKAQIVHYKGGSSKKKNPKLIYEFYRAMYLFYNKHYKRKYSSLITLLVYAGIGCILGLKLFVNALKPDRGK